eukprot:14580472-Alexandrium_andersonii.AAC.1
MCIRDRPTVGRQVARSSHFGTCTTTSGVRTWNCAGPGAASNFSSLTKALAKWPLACDALLSTPATQAGLSRPLAG